MHTQTREVALHVPRLSEDSGKGTGTEQLWGMHRKQGVRELAKLWVVLVSKATNLGSLGRWSSGR